MKQFLWTLAACFPLSLTWNLTVGLNVCFAQAQSYDLQISHGDARDTLLEMLKEPSIPAEKIAQMVRSYRSTPVPGIPTIQDGPYVGFILQNQIADDSHDPTCKVDATHDCKSSWETIRDGQEKSFYDEYVNQLTPSGLYDLLMKAIANNVLPAGSLKKTGDQIGSCLAEKIEKGAGEKSCPALDDSSSLGSRPSVLKLAWMKYTCFMPFVTSPCNARHTVYAYAKPMLLENLKPVEDHHKPVMCNTPLTMESHQCKNILDEYFPQIFPPLLRTLLLSGVNGIRATIAQFASGKFGAEPDLAFWSGSPLIDLQDPKNYSSDPAKVAYSTNLGEFAQGLAADMRASSALVKSNPELAAPLFYAAANRLLVLMGGIEATWDPAGKRFAPAPGNQFDPEKPLAAPVFQKDTFGGFGVVNSSSGPVVKTWDISNYDPTSSPLELLPSQFYLGAESVPSLIPDKDPIETMEDLGQTMSALMDFLELSESTAPLASHFVDVDAPGGSDKLTDDKDPALFPSQGRVLAIGMIVAMVRNMIAPNGHVVVPDSSSTQTLPEDEHSGLLGFRYYDQIGLKGRVEGKVPTTALASVFGAAARFSRLAGNNDPDVPKALLDLKTDIDKAVELSMLSMVARSQQIDGSFVHFMGDPSTSPKELDTQIQAMTALETVYDQSHSPAQRLSIRQAWSALDQFWASGDDTPTGVLGGGGGNQDSVSPILLWRTVNLWNLTMSTAIYTDLMNPALDATFGKNGWDKWQARFEALRAKLIAQLDSSLGPEPIVPGN
jgi:hypothetical protein